MTSFGGFGRNPELGEGQLASLKDLREHPGWAVLEEIRKKQIEDLRDCCEIQTTDVRYWQGQIAGAKDVFYRVERALAPKQEVAAEHEVFDHFSRYVGGRSAAGGY